MPKKAKNSEIEHLFLRSRTIKMERTYKKHKKFLIFLINKLDFISLRKIRNNDRTIEYIIQAADIHIDLDFTVDCDRESMLSIRQEVNNEILRYMESDGYHLAPGSKTPHTLDSWVFHYTNAAGNNDGIKIEIEDKEMVNRIKFHPMALWKTRSR